MRSGKSLIVIRGLAPHNELQDVLHLWATVAIQHDTVTSTKYAALRARSHRHARALRGVADRLLYVACIMLENQTVFGPIFRSEDRAVRPMPDNNSHAVASGY